MLSKFPINPKNYGLNMHDSETLSSIIINNYISIPRVDSRSTELEYLGLKLELYYLKVYY